jgi:hypothetical protein
MKRMVTVGAGALWLASAGCSKAQPEPTGDAKASLPVQVAAAVAASPDVPAAARPASPAPDCNQLCEPVRRLGCARASECVNDCRHMASIELCRPLLLQFYSCLSSEPSEHWECLDDGTGAIREGYCEREQSTFAACLEKSDVN